MYRVQDADQKEYGPIPAERVREWIAQGRLNRQSLASAEASPGWKPLWEFPEFVADLGGPATAIPGVPAPFQTGSAIPGASPVAAGAPRQNVLAIVSLVSGILALLLACCCYGVPFNIVGIVCGFIALSQLRGAADQSGRGMAITGLVLSFASLALAITFLIIGVAFNGADILRHMKR